MNWKRVLAWAFLMFAAEQLVGFCSGLSLAHWQIYGDTFEHAIDNARWVRRIAIVVVLSILYFAFVRRTPEHRLRHALAVFGALQIAYIAISFALTLSLEQSIDPGASARALLACLLGLSAAAALSQRSARRSPASARTFIS